MTMATMMLQRPRASLGALRKYATRVSPLSSSINGSRAFSTSDASSPLTILSKQKVAGGGYYHRIQHASTSTNTDMILGLFLPSKAEKVETPVLFWLSGLTCDESNFSQKAGSRAFAAAEQQGIAIVVPDTSPRGNNVANVDSYDLGQGAGFYVDATEEPYKEHYQMHSYITKELPELLAN
jgi:S-formylglutathione hydrolase